MRAVIQRVSEASVKIVGESAYVKCDKVLPYVSGAIGAGLLVLVAVEDADTDDDAAWLASKIAKLRVFEDAQGKMNLSVCERGGDVLVVSQFTLFGNLKKGSRPSFNRSAAPDISIPMCDKFNKALEAEMGRAPQLGVFGAMMEVSLKNDGPVTIILDSKNKDF